MRVLNDLWVFHIDENKWEQRGGLDSEDVSTTFLKYLSLPLSFILFSTLFY